ncbi:hypothetical protein ACKKBG_A06770 [Auxenochlorella protothecoides x Auxenochlorella symbiontica]
MVQAGVASLVQSLNATLVEVFDFDLSHCLEDLDDLQIECMGSAPLNRLAVMQRDRDSGYEDLRDICMGH